MDRHATLRRTAVLVLVASLALANLPATALAAPIQGLQGTVVVEEGQTVDGIQVAAGTVVIRGTVDGDVQVATGNLLVPGTVTGDVEAGAGSVVIDGEVGGDVRVGAGSLVVGEGAVIGGALEAGAGSAQIAGTVVGDAVIGAGSIVLEPTATFEGDLRYDGELDNRGATVEGTVIRDESLSGMEVGAPEALGPVLGVYGFLVNLVLGAVLLLALPETSRRLADRVVDAPLTTGLYGLVSVLVAPLLLVLVAVTIVGIPLALAGAVLFGLAVWVGTVYGRYAIGEWLLGYTEVENRWVALLLGLVLVAVVARIPFLGGLVQFLVLVLGLGGLVAVGHDRYRRRRATGTSVGSTAGAAHRPGERLP